MGECVWDSSAAGGKWHHDLENPTPLWLILCSTGGHWPIDLLTYFMAFCRDFPVLVAEIEDFMDREAGSRKPYSISSLGFNTGNLKASAHCLGGDHCEKCLPQCLSLYWHTHQLSITHFLPRLPTSFSRTRSNISSISAGSKVCFGL